MTARIPTTVLGATGVVGQRFVRRLANHPLFELKHLAASPSSAGKQYKDACSWRLQDLPYGGLGDTVLQTATPDTALAPVVFSALDSGPAQELEPLFADAGALVFSNASTFRMSPQVPLVVPEVNPGHLDLIHAQRVASGRKGAIVCNPNCTSAILATALAPLQAQFGIEALHVVSMQAVSGAGYPGVPSLDILGNVVPFIPNEEEKVEEEAAKMLGTLADGRIQELNLSVSASCHRVPVLEGHCMAVSVRLGGSPTPEAAAAAISAFRGRPQELELPTAPKIPIHLHALADRPQVRMDVDAEDGMAVHVGRLRPCAHYGIKFFLVGHNTERGAAGGSILNAELAVQEGLLP